jgi:hypothetical protein
MMLEDHWSIVFALSRIGFPSADDFMRQIFFSPQTLHIRASQFCRCAKSEFITV